MQSEVASANFVGDDRTSPPLPPPERIQELLFEAARLGRGDVIPALIQAGADLAAYDASGFTALILASYNGKQEAVKLLLELGAEVDQADGARGNTALMGAVFKGFAEIVNSLLEAGAAPDFVNKAGQTALMFAALFGRSEIADRLIANGADRYLLDVAGNSAVSLAAAQDNENMLAQLEARRR